MAHAQAPDEGGIAIEEIVVTAERREANLQDVPISVSSFSADTLQALQVDNIGDLQSLVPNLSVHVGDANNAVVYLRGVGQIDSIAFFEPGVGIYLDDVYLGRAQGAFLDVVDVDRIEVLRGPQGSLYRATLSGPVAGDRRPSRRRQRRCRPNRRLARDSRCCSPRGRSCRGSSSRPTA